MKERIGADDKRGGIQLDEGCEGGVDLAFVAGLQDMELHPLRAAPPRCMSPMMRSAFAHCRVHEQSDHLGLGNQLGKQLEPLRHQLDGKEADACKVAARPGETGDKAGCDRVARR